MGVEAGDAEAGLGKEREEGREEERRGQGTDQE